MPNHFGENKIIGYLQIKAIEASLFRDVDYMGR
jgi:hypothetical protein